MEQCNCNCSDPVAFSR